MKKIAALILSATLLVTAFGGCGGSSSKNETSKKKYIIATDAKYAPFEYEKDGKYVGIDIDLLDAISKLEGFQYELKPMDFKGIIPGIQANQLDAAIAGISISDERKKILDFSDGYFQAGLSAVVKKDNDKILTQEDLKGKSFAVKKGTLGSKYAEENKTKLGASVKYFDDSPSMFQEVINGNSDVTFEDYPVIAYKLSLENNSNLRIVGDRLYKDYYGFAVKKGTNKELVDMFNNGLKKLKDSGEYDKILSKYIKK